MRQSTPYAGAVRIADRIEGTIDADGASLAVRKGASNRGRVSPAGVEIVRSGTSTRGVDVPCRSECGEECVECIVGFDVEVSASGRAVRVC